MTWVLGSVIDGMTRYNIALPLDCKGRRSANFPPARVAFSPISRLDGQPGLPRGRLLYFPMQYQNLDGVLLIDKAAGMTSHDVVAMVRRRLGIKKVGHCGTLDPLATGLLIVVIGRGTKIQDLLMAE